MKKHFLFLLLPIACFSQVGIGTDKPQKELHVAGPNSTIRIEKLNSINQPILNNGVKLAPVYVDGDGELTITPPNYLSGGGSPGTVAPLNFLITIPNFIPDNTGKGFVINNDASTSTANAQIVSVPFTSPQSALIEVKYGVTVVVSSTDINTSFNVFTDFSARSFQIYFCIDLNSDGLDAIELSKKYGYKGQNFGSGSLGILGYPYMNAHGYANIPAGNHSLVFFGESIDGINKYTSVGFGGDIDYLKIRLFN